MLSFDLAPTPTVASAMQEPQADITQQDTAASVPAFPAFLLASSPSPLPRPAWLVQAIEATTLLASNTGAPVPAVASAAYVEARTAALRHREALVASHLAAQRVWPTTIAMPALEIIALPATEWSAFRPDHGIVVTVEALQAAQRETLQ